MKRYMVPRVAHCGIGAQPNPLRILPQADSSTGNLFTQQLHTLSFMHFNPFGMFGNILIVSSHELVFHSHRVRNLFE